MFIENDVIVFEKHFSFDFCGVADEPSPVENLGQVLFGERIRPSPYKVNIQLN
jgi:transmembrane 9 superfamily protein 2/4